MTIDPEDPVVRLAVFGEEVRLFLNSDIGQYLMQCADEQREHALKRLRTVDATSSFAILSLQKEIEFLERFEGWLTDAIRSGTQATESLKESR